MKEYVFTLKRLVGMNALIEAVGIGRGKQDLTNMALEPTRSNHALTMRSEIPTGKACSSLTPNEIIKYLTGGYRLSKARSNDLFWEAVWPLLLARGWHSEQPKNMAYAAGGSKHSLVFLMPGVKKFSRKLVKGNHYFDSVTDILGKVASEPKLLDLDTEDHVNNKNQDEGHHGANVESDDLPTVRCHSYLQPRTPNQCTDDIKFTVVDTSLSDGKPYKVRDLKSLSSEISIKLSTQTHSEDSGKDSQKVSTDIPDSVNTMLLDQAVLISANSNTSLPNGETSSGRKDLEVGATNRKMANVRNKEVHASCVESIPVSNAMNNVDLCEDMKSTTVVKPRISQKPREENVIPITKRRRRLTACSRTETNNISCVSRVELAMPSCCSSVNNMPASNALQMGSFQDKMSSTSSSKSSPSVSTECVPVNNLCVAEVSPVETQPRILIDLNVLPVSPDSENGLSLTEMTEEQSDIKKPESHSELQVVRGVDSSDQQQPPSMSMSSRRHSTRNRPPTMRALEALANGFLTVNRRQKNREAGPRQNLGSKSSQQAHGGTKAAEFGNSSEVSKMEEGTNNVFNRAENNVFSKFQPPPDRNGGTTSGP